MGGGATTPTARLTAPTRSSCCTRSCPDKIIGIGLNYRSHAAESELDIPARAGRLREVRLVPDRARRGDRDPARGDAPRLRGRGRRRDRAGRLPRRPRRGARRDRRHLPRSTTCPAGAPSSRRRCASSRSARASTRSRRSGPCDRLDRRRRPRRHRPAHDGLGRGHAGRQHARPDLLGRRADRVHLGRE